MAKIQILKSTVVQMQFVIPLNDQRMQDNQIQEISAWLDALQQLQQHWH
ncbi:hypothetical protein [Acinetobacter sp. MD2]|nr:hypothetical protein [Acinetobacter sp. MD2]MEB3767696.1 hypothetical protein [Acinetobacter sp. MD2]